MKDHELRFSILDITVLALGLKALKEQTAKMQQVEAIADIIDYLVYKIDRQMESWGEPTEAEATFMQGMDEVFDEIRRRNQS